jgi:Periplasmic binding protein
MRAMRAFTMLLVALAVGLVAAGCGSGGDKSSAGSKSPIKIGASLPLTGDFSEPGKAARQGYQVWQNMVNDRGGLLGRKVQIVVRDDASDQNTVVADYNALIRRQKVNLLLGTFSSLLNIPASTVAERNRMLYVEPAGGAPEIFSRGYKYLFFAQQATADHQGDLFAQYILGLPPRDSCPAIDCDPRCTRSCGPRWVFSPMNARWAGRPIVLGRREAHSDVNWSGDQDRGNVDRRGCRSTEGRQSTPGGVR